MRPLGTQGGGQLAAPGGRRFRGAVRAHSPSTRSSTRALGAEPSKGGAVSA